jgi:hypothetical protein
LVHESILPLNLRRRDADGDFMWSSEIVIGGLSALATVVVLLERWLARTELRAVNHEYEMLCAPTDDMRFPLLGRTPIINRS